MEWFSAKEIYVRSSRNLFCGNSVPIMENRGAGRRGRRRKQLLDNLKETRGYWKFKEGALDHTEENSFRRVYGPFVRHTTR
jgi:hypothetical protein